MILRDGFQLWARTNRGDPVTLRASGDAWTLKGEGERLARASIPDGVVCVWVQSLSGEIVWQAGEPPEPVFPELDRAAEKRGKG